MKSSEGKIGLILLSWDGNRLSKENGEEIASRLEFAEKLPRKNVLYMTDISSRPHNGNENELSETIKKNGFSKVVLGGCSSFRHKRLLERLTEQTGLTEHALYPVTLSLATQAKGEKKRVEEAYQLLGKAVDTISLLPSFETKTISLNQNVLVVGGGIAGIQTAAALNSRGYSTTLLEKRDVVGGDLTAWVKDFNRFKEAEFSDNLESIVILTDSAVKTVKGHVGGFAATFDTPNGEMSAEFGALVLAPGIQNGDDWAKDLISGPSGEAAERMIPIEQLRDTIETMPHIRRRRSIGIVLDVVRDETKASTEMALTLAERIQERELFDAYLFLRDVRVASLDLEAYYDQVRDRGVTIVKYETITIASTDEGIAVTCRDAVLGSMITVDCDTVGVSRYGLDFSVDTALAEITGVDLDAYGQMQKNNIRLFPGETNRPGIFVVGSARGTYYIPDILREAKSVAESVHTLLSKKTMTVEKSNAVVDADKCVLCLTCIRSCPYKAMEINHEKGAAESNPESCQRCGICAGECPAKAIELPVYSDTIVFSQMRS